MLSVFFKNYSAFPWGGLWGPTLPPGYDNFIPPPQDRVKDQKSTYGILLDTQKSSSKTREYWIYPTIKYDITDYGVTMNGRSQVP